MMIFKISTNRPNELLQLHPTHHQTLPLLKDEILKTHSFTIKSNTKYLNMIVHQIRISIDHIKIVDFS